MTPELQKALLTLKEDGYTITGGPKNPQGYMEWILSKNGQMLTTFYGPQSMVAIMGYVSMLALNRDWDQSVRDAADVYSIAFR